MKTFVKQHPLVTYFTLTYLFSWSVFVPLALKKHELIHFPVPFSIYYLASFGPLLAAIITTGIIGGSECLKELIGRMFRWHVRPVWWIVALSPILLLLVTIHVYIQTHKPFKHCIT
jgi:hypothetical protein